MEIPSKNLFILYISLLCAVVFPILASLVLAKRWAAKSSKAKNSDEVGPIHKKFFFIF